MTTQSEKLTVIRDYCSSIGRTFKIDDDRLFNSKRCYKIVKKSSNDVLHINLNINDSYEKLVVMGFI